MPTEHKKGEALCDYYPNFQANQHHITSLLSRHKIFIQSSLTYTESRVGYLETNTYSLQTFYS